MEAILVSTGVVALAEMGDKIQIATIALAAHYTEPVMVIAGATLVLRYEAQHAQLTVCCSLSIYSLLGFV